jgi:hypothetical protein
VAPDADTLQRVVLPSVGNGVAAPGIRFGDPRVVALLASLVSFTHVVAGFSNASLRSLVEAHLGRPYASRQMTYDLRRRGVACGLGGHGGEPRAHPPPSASRSRRLQDQAEPQPLAEGLLRHGRPEAHRERRIALGGLWDPKHYCAMPPAPFWSPLLRCIAGRPGLVGRPDDRSAPGRKRFDRNWPSTCCLASSGRLGRHFPPGVRRNSECGPQWMLAGTGSRAPGGAPAT